MRSRNHTSHSFRGRCNLVPICRGERQDPGNEFEVNVGQCDCLPISLTLCGMWASVTSYLLLPEHNFSIHIESTV